MGNSIVNALSNAARGLVGNIVGLVNGQNPPIQPQIAQLIGFNLPATPLISTRDYFLLQLQTWLSAPAIQSQWVALIESFPPALNSQILRNLERTMGNPHAYDINVPRTLLTAYPYQRVAGCIFCNSMEIPEETCSVENVSVENNRGFLPGIVSGSRQGYADKQLIMGFMDTNTSFIDLVIRPWIMLASHYGQITRSDPRYKVKTNITLLSFGKTYQNISQVPRKVFRFYNCVPTTVARQNFEYEEPTSITSYTANFSFSNYTVENSMYLPIPQIIASTKSN